MAIACLNAQLNWLKSLVTFGEAVLMRDRGLDD